MMLKSLQKEKLSKYLNRVGLPVILVFIGGYVYFDYIVFDKLFIFSQFASDSLTQFYPWLYYYSGNLNKLAFPFWSYQFELGMNIYTLSINHNPFDMLLALTGEKNIVYAIPYINILKNITAGLFFFAFLKKLRLDNSVAILCSILFSFCGYMIVNGHWYHYQNYAVFVAVALYCFERWYQDGRWLALLLIFGFLNLKGLLQIAQLLIFFSIYIPFRCILDGHTRLRFLFKHYLLFFIVFTLGIGISAFYLLPNIDIILQSSRGSHSVSDMVNLNIFQKIFSFPTFADWRTLFFRFISSDILGSFQHFKGVGSYLESPAAYIGLASFAVIPGVILIRPFHKKMAMLFLLVVCFFFFLFPILRSASNLFASSTYKYGILYISVFLLILTGFSLDNYFKNPEINNRFTILISVTILMLLAGVNLMATNNDIQMVVDRKILMTANIFFGIYLLLLIACALRPYQWVKLLIIGVMIFEIALFAKITVSRASGITPRFVDDGECYFNDDTKAAITYIKNRDSSKFFRIAQDHHGCTLNDALVQGYNGTTGYHGFGSTDLVSFYQELGLSKNSPRLDSYRFGFEKSPYLMSLFNVKYYIADDPGANPEGFKLIKRFGKRYLYENQYTLPLGISYENELPRSKFHKIKANGKKRALLLKSFVQEKAAERSNRLKTIDTEEVNRIKAVPSEVFDWNTEIETRNMHLLSSNHKDEFSYITKSEDPMIIFSMEKTRYFNDLKIKINIQSETDTIGQIFWKISAFAQTKSLMFRVAKGRRTYVLDLGKVSFNSLRFDVGAESSKKIHIHKIRLFTHHISGMDFEESIAKLKDGGLNLLEFKDNYLKGTIQTNTKKMLFFSIPYDHGWSARLNGRETPLEKINFGFLGLKIPPGSYIVELKFIPRLLYEGVVLSILSLFIAIFLYYRFPKFKVSFT